MQKRLSRALRIGVAGPVGSGKTALVDCLSRVLYPAYNLAVITNDIYTREDAEFLLRQGTLPAERVRGVETGGCPHAAIREDASMNLEAIADLEETLPDLELIFVESGGDNLAAAFSPDLVDFALYVIDVAEGEKIPRKGGPGITRSDLLVINKIDLAPAVGASLEVMERDTRRMRGTRPYVLTNLKVGTGLKTIVNWIEELMQVPVEQRRVIIDAHAPYQGQPHTHGGVAHSHGDWTHTPRTAPITADVIEGRVDTLYLDCFSGISGDMFLGCLLDGGLQLESLKRELAKLHLPAFQMDAQSQMKGYLRGTRLLLDLPEQESHRRLRDVEAIIKSSDLSASVKEKSLKVFTLLAEAEGRVHGITPEEVHFHEVGALDAIVDVVGVVAGLDLLGIERVFASALPLGSGWVRAAHGILPVPAPAVMYLLAQVQAPTVASEIKTELVTPTGAALLAGLATFRRPDMQIKQVGYGLGKKDLEHPNALGGWFGSLIEQEVGMKPLLPPRYQDGENVSAAPMGSAELCYDEAGQVAWDQIWGDFCDLALAGGPPHRGTLLEPVSPVEVAADPDGYERVCAEIERGWRMVTGLKTVRSQAAGWIGLICESEEMALWLLRAILVENVSVRREGSVLYLPAGPAFEMDKEVKNVITVVAKTHHYWSEHRDSLR